MLRGKLSIVFRKQWIKCLSTRPSPKTENELHEEIVPEDTKQNEILQNADYFKVYNLFTVRDLFDARVHYGHKDISLTRNMKPFVFGSRLGHIIFDLDLTAYHLREALNFTAHIAYRNGIILFISKNPRMTLLVENTAKECKEYAVTRQWKFGTFTNADKIRQFMRLPDLCIILNTLEENGYQHQAISEAAKLCIPTIGIVDSNCNPNLITYPVPGNDDSFSCFELYCKLFKEAILRGKSERHKHLMESSKVEEAENKKTVQSNEVNTENTETAVSNKIIPENIQSVQSNEITPENTETAASNEMIPENIQSVQSNEITPENTETAASNEMIPENTGTVKSTKETTSIANPIKNLEIDTNINDDSVKKE